MVTSVFGIDMGTSNLKIYASHDKGTMNERDVIAVEEDGKVLAIGNEAFEMYEKTPDHIQVTFPVVNGVIADIDRMQCLFRGMMEKSAGRFLRGGKFVVAVPSDVTEVEKRAFYDLVRMANVRERKILFVEKPIADAVGLGLDVNSAKGIMIVDVGADTTEISVLSLGGIVLSKLLQIGGNHLDDAIVMAIKKEQNLLIGRRTAERIKKALIGGGQTEEEDSISVYGRDVVCGLPMERTITRELVLNAVGELMHGIVDAAKMILERTPPELSSDIIENGIYLTGGSANIMELAQLMASETELVSNVGRVPEECVIKGLTRIIEDEKFAGLAGEMTEKIYR